MLTQDQKIAIRRHCGVPFSGTAQAGRLMGWRFTWYREDLEYRMNNLQPSEERLLTGVALGSYRIDGRPSVGDLLTYTVTPQTGAPLSGSYSVRQQDFQAPANPVNPSDAAPSYQIALNSAIALTAVIAASGYAAVGSMPADLFSQAYLPPNFAELLVMGPSSAPFTLSGSVTGTTNLFVSDPGSPCPIAASVIDAATGQSRVAYGYIDLLNGLSMQSARADLSLAYQSADVVKFRPDEIAARRVLYETYRLEMLRVIGGEQYVQQFGARSSGGATA